MAVIIFMVVSFLYVLPTLIAWSRKCKAVLAIGILNMCLGWSVLMWLIAALWALIGDVNGDEDSKY